MVDTSKVARRDIRKRKTTLAILSIGIVIGLLIAAPIHFFLLNSTNSADTERFPYLAKRIQIDNPNDTNVNFSDLRHEFEEYLAGLGDEGGDVSIYFEYLPSGVSINVHEKSEAYAASLMKLPAVMSIYKAAELGKANLDTVIEIKPEWLNDDYGTLYQKGAGYKITLREAARLALKDSDNTAILAITDAIASAGLQVDDYSLNYLDVEFALIEDSRVEIGARSYSSILKCLYLSCYNTLEDSSEILEYLTESSFKNRLTRNLPIDVKVAHKIGTFNVQSQSDCGIIYLPNKQYILCVMVELDDPLASDIIAKLSRITYDYVDAIQLSIPD